MADDFKTTVSRTIDTTDRQYTNVIWQAGRPPLDSELNFVGQIATDNLATSISANAHSGILMNPRTSDRGFIFNPLWSNFLKIKPFKALVNGLVINIGEKQINLSPPPEDTGTRVDFVFLEVWKTIISADGSEGDLTNKPTSTTVYTNGDVEGVNALDDQMVDSNVGFETTKRVQVQYRFRVVDAINIYSHLEGMSSNLVFAQGPLANVSNVSFTNQHANGDAGLWVADMTATASPLLSENVIYGLPICAITRRNDNVYVASSVGGTNQNGSVDRKPSSINSSNATTLTQATLTSPLLTSTLDGNIAITNGVGSGLDDASLFNNSDRYFVLGEGLNKEIIRVSGFTSPNLTLVSRGQSGTQIKYHSAGTKISLYNNRPDGKYADQIHQDDLFDMRHATTLGEWDYQSLLESSLSDLLFGNLTTAYKQNYLNASTAGSIIEEVSVIDPQANLGSVHKMDTANGFRDTWSDASVPQMGLTMYLNLSATNTQGLTTTNLNDANAPSWEIGPDLNPRAFFYDDNGNAIMRSGSWIKIDLNVANSNLTLGVNSAKNPSTLSERGVRFIAPREIRDTNVKRSPFTIEELGERHSKLHYPTLESNFEKPFIVLGGSKQTTAISTVVDGDATTNNFYILYEPTAANTASLVSDPVAFSNTEDRVIAIRPGSSGQQMDNNILALESLITNGGYDTSGNSSSLYAVLYGDPVYNNNNSGVFKVVRLLKENVGTYYTDVAKTDWTPTSKIGFIILKPIDNISRGALSENKNLTLEFRTQEITDTDTDVMIAITESVAHVGSNPITTLGQLYMDSTQSEFQLGVSVLYPSTIGATANVTKNIHKIGLVPPDSTGEFLNNSKSVLQGTDFAQLSLVENEIELPTKNHVSLWNRLPSSNLPVGVSLPTQMGGRIINEEVDREAEAFTDELSKTVVLRPFQKKSVILHKATKANLQLNNVTLPLIPNTWGDGNNKSTDPNPQMFLDTKDAAFVLPEQLVPRFGRQDIPLHTHTTGGDQFRNGLNHLFIDKPLASSDQVFTVVGGLDNANPGVKNVLFVTGDQTASWGERTTLNIIDGGTGIAAKKTTLTVPSSDFGSTLKGIELPPYYGIVRVYGVYHTGLFKDYLDATNAGHDSNRVGVANSVSNGNCPNLLRTDTSDFTMYIHKDGGKLLVNGDDGLINPNYKNAHTYMLTEHAIDISRLQGKTLLDTTSVGWNENSTFDSFDYVVEAVVFMFADGFISHNRFILPREHNGSGQAQNETGTSKLQVDCVIPFAPPTGSHITISAKRCPYQGDPLNTISQLDQTVSQGRKSLSELQLGTKDQSVVNTANTNRRNVEVLASMDFYTTLGTGKIGGAVYPTTITDVGHTPFPPKRDPSTMLNDSLTHIPLKTSTFTGESTRMGGWASLFLFEEAETSYTNNVKIYAYKNGTQIKLTDSTNEIVLSDSALLDHSNRVLRALQSVGFNCFQTRGEIRQNFNVNKNYFGILVQAPNPVDDFEIEVYWNSVLVGQDIQVFEGLRESPLSFQMIDSGSPATTNYEYELNNRSTTRVAFSKISILPLNAGDGNTPISLTGITSRLPIGSLVRDSDFVCEDILSDRSSYLFSSTGSFSTISNPVPVSPNGVPYTATLGVSGDVLQMNDGILFDLPNPASQPKYTISRGGGSVFGVGGEVPGGPLSFLATSYGKSHQPVLKGSALAGRAMLVLNSYEVEDGSGDPKSYGSELQLLVVTHAIDGGETSITLGGDISPSGYGEGFASSDRFRIKGKPLAKIYNQETEKEITPAPYNS